MLDENGAGCKEGCLSTAGMHFTPYDWLQAPLSIVDTPQRPQKCLAKINHIVDQALLATGMVCMLVMVCVGSWKIQGLFPPFSLRDASFVMSINPRTKKTTAVLYFNDGQHEEKLATQQNMIAHLLSLYLFLYDNNVVQFKVRSATCICAPRRTSDAILGHSSCQYDALRSQRYPTIH